MTKLDILLSGIRKDSQKEADHILDNAKKRSEEIKTKENEKAQKEAELIINDAKKDCTRISENSKTTSKRQARDIKIEAKNEVVRDILKKLQQSLEKMGPNQYKSFVENRLKEIDLEEGEIILQKDMKYHFDKDDFTNFKISDESVDQGFIVRKGNISYDNRYESILNYDRDDLEKTIADRIFKWGDLNG